MAKTATNPKSLDMLTSASSTAQAVAEADPVIAETFEIEGGLVTLEEPKVQHATPEIERLRAQNIMLQSQMEGLRDARDQAQSDAMIAAAERDALQVKLAEYAVIGEPEFDPQKPYELRVDFNGLVGPGQHLSYPRGTRLTDPYVLNLLHTAGADLKRA